MHLEKARGIFGKDAEGFEAQLTKDESGEPRWTCRDLGEEDENLLNQLLEPNREGESVRDMEEINGVPKSSIRRKLKAAKKMQPM